MNQRPYVPVRRNVESSSLHVHQIFTLLAIMCSHGTATVQIHIHSLYYGYLFTYPSRCLPVKHAQGTREAVVGRRLDHILSVDGCRFVQNKNRDA